MAVLPVPEAGHIIRACPHYPGGKKPTLRSPWAGNETERRGQETSEDSEDGQRAADSAKARRAPERPAWEVLAESQAADRPASALIRATTHGVAVMIIVAAVIASYSNTLRNGFALDDEVIIARNQHIRSLANVPRLFGMNWWRMTDVPAAGNLYRPLAAASFALDIAVMRATGRPEDGGGGAGRD